jgi:hypothetical protein
MIAHHIARSIGGQLCVLFTACPACRQAKILVVEPCATPSRQGRAALPPVMRVGEHARHSHPVEPK